MNFAKSMAPRSRQALSRSAMPAVANVNISQFRSMSSKIDTNSWAAERLLSLGVDLPAGPELPLTEATEELLKNPPKKIKDLTDDIIGLNILEINQLMRSIQVSCRVEIVVCGAITFCLSCLCFVPSFRRPTSSNQTTGDVAIH